MAKAKNHILIPIDFSPQSIIALEQAFNLANATDASITILYVIEHSVMSTLFTSKKQENQHKMDIQKKLDKIVAKAEKNLKNPMETMIAEGKVYSEVVDIAKKIRAKFIVMAKSEHNSFIGSNTLRVVREAQCPVITIKGTVHRPYCKHIVLPLDLNKETREKVSTAIEVAKHFGSTVHVVAVQVSDDKFLVDKLKVILAQVKNYVHSKGVEVTAEMVHATDVSKEIVNYSKKVKADLVLIMTQQELDFTEFFIGSSAQQIINKCDIPVMSVRPTGKNYTYSYSHVGLHS